MRDARCGMRRTAPELRNRRVFASLQMIHGAIVDQPPPRDLYDHLFFPRRPIHAVVRDAADRLGGKLPLRRNRLHIRDPVCLGDDQHALLRLGEQDLVRRHPRLEPTTTSTLPTPCAAAVIRSASRSSPTHMALTSGFPL